MRQLAESTSIMVGVPWASADPNGPSRAGSSSSDRVPQDSLFGPGSVCWKVNREAVLVLGGGRALLLQLAHPLIAAGIADHSRFQQEPLTRLWNTLDSMLRIVFGGRDVALATARRIGKVHARVRGTLREGTAAFPAGTRYSATDPELLLWVYATLVDSALVGYEALVQALREEERAGFFAESRRIAELLGVPPLLIPPTFAAFQAHVRDMITGPQLEVTSTARALAEAVLHPPLRLVPRCAPAALSLISLALLPAEIRQRYGFPWHLGHRLASEATLLSVRSAIPLLPRFARLVPHARRAERDALMAEL